jgi:hypothetical protein
MDHPGDIGSASMRRVRPMAVRKCSEGSSPGIQVVRFGAEARRSGSCGDTSAACFAVISAQKAWVRDTEPYQHLLGITAPWTVERVALDVPGGRVDVWAKHDEKARFACPECGKECGLYAHDEEGVWRHLDSCQFQTFLHARISRVRCDEHGIRQARVPWAEPKSRFTMLFERLAIDVVLSMDLTDAARLLGLSWDEARHIGERAVSRGLSRRSEAPPRRLGVDEKAIAKRHQYATILVDIERGRVLEVVKDRRKVSLAACYAGLGPEAVESVEAVAMDILGQGRLRCELHPQQRSLRCARSAVQFCMAVPEGPPLRHEAVSVQERPPRWLSSDLQNLREDLARTARWILRRGRDAEDPPPHARGQRGARLRSARLHEPRTRRAPRTRHRTGLCWRDRAR